MPAVSVIMPTYNRADLIAQTIESVLTQTYQDLELLVVDDGSTDSTAERVAFFKSDKIRYYRLSRGGRSRARNFGMKESTGRYLCFIDSDDLFLPFKVTTQVQMLDKNPGYGMIYTAAYCINQRGERFPCAYNREDILKAFARNGERFAYFALKSGDIYYDVAFHVPLTVLLPTVMIRREVYGEVGDFDVSLDRFEDTDYWRRVSKKFRILGWDEPTCEVRVHAGNDLRNADKKVIFRNLSRYAEKVRREDADKGRLRIRLGLERLFMYYAKAVIAQSHWQESLPFIRKAVSLYPFDFWMIRLYGKRLASRLSK